MAQIAGSPDKVPAGSAIASLAILKVNADQGADYIDSFVPFVAVCLSKSPADVVSLTDLQRMLRTEFGLEIPQGALRTILDRATRKGYATRHEHMYTRNQETLHGLEFDDVRARALREQQDLTRRLVAFSATLLGVPWDETRAENELIAYLADRGTSLLTDASVAAPLPAAHVPTREEEYVLNSFVANLHSQDVAGFTYLTTVVKGSVLASVLYFNDLGSIKQHFGGIGYTSTRISCFRRLGGLGRSSELPAQN
jgi:hypothetical protein